MKITSFTQLVQYLHEIGAKKKQPPRVILFISGNQKEYPTAQDDLQWVLHHYKVVLNAIKYPRIHYEGDEITASTLQLLTYGYDLFAASSTAYILMQAHQIASNLRLELIEGLLPSENLNNDPFFIEISATDAALKKEWGKISEIAVEPTNTQYILIRLKDLKPWERQQNLTQWVEFYLKKEKVHWNQNFCNQIVARFEGKPLLIQQELDKMITFLYQRESDSTLYPAAFGLLSTSSYHTIWQLRESILQRNMSEALAAVHDLLVQGQEPFLLIGSLRQLFQQALHLLEESSSMSFAVTYPNITGKQLEKLRESANFFGAHSFRRALEILYEADCRLRQAPSEVQVTLILESAVIKAVAGGS